MKTCIHRGDLHTSTDHPDGHAIEMFHCSRLDICTETDHGLTRLSTGKPMAVCETCPLYESPKVVSAICLTHDFPRRLPALNEAVESFHQQTWPNKELIIVNDTPGVTLEYEHPDVTIINLPERFQSLGEKRNAGIELASGEFICIWDDDDISLPWRMQQVVDVLSDNEYLSPDRIWTLTGNEWEHKERKSFCFHSGGFRKSAWKEIGGYKPISNGEDGQLHDAFIARGNVATRVPKTAYIYRWNDGQYHVSGHGPGDKAYRDAAKLSTPGTYKITPAWKMDYAAKTESQSTAPKFCYYTCTTTEDGALMAEAMIRSARSVGVEEEFHVCAPRPVKGAVMHPYPFKVPRQWSHMEKTMMLRDTMQPLDFDYFVWLDTDHYFVRHPGNLQSLIRDNKIWVCMENDFTSPKNRHKDWHGPSYQQLADTMRELGGKDPKYNTNGGMFIVRKEAIPEFSELMFKAFDLWMSRGFREIYDEPPLATVGHLMVKDIELNTHVYSRLIWDCDWTAANKDIPTGKSWIGENWITGEKYLTNPAIVHCMKIKDKLIAQVRQPAQKPTKTWRLGDQIERALSAVGITHERVEAVIGAPCNCPARKEKLNRWSEWAQRLWTGSLTQDEARKQAESLVLAK